MFRSYSCSTTHTELLSTMDEVKNLIKGLRRKDSTLSLHSVASSFAPSLKTKISMKQFCKNLYKAGVTGDIIRDREAEAIAIFQYPNAPPVVDQGVLVYSEERIEEQQKGEGRNRTLRINSTGLTEPVLNVAAGANMQAIRSDDGSVRLDSAAYDRHTDMAKMEVIRSDDRSTPLDSAAYDGNIDVVRLLLERGANIEAVRRDGSTALYTASRRGHLHVARLLLGKGANIEAARSDGSTDRKSTRLNSSHLRRSRMPSSA